MNGTRSILDRIKNLTSDESKVLAEFNRKIEESNKNKNKAEDEKENFEKEITNIQNDIDDITKASEISDRFSNLDGYMPGLEKLGKSVNLLQQLKDELNKIPEEIENLENKIKELTDQVDNRTKTIKEEDDELSKLDVEISDARRYQTNLIELIDLAKTGNINKTREEVVETLVHVGFSGKEAVSAAKVILFPEDDLIPYFSKEDNVVNTSQEEVVPTEEDNEKSNVTNYENIEDNSEQKLDIPEIEEDSTFSSIEEIKLDSFDDDTKLDTVNIEEEHSLDEIKETIEKLGYDSSKFSIDDLNVDITTLKVNLEFINSKNIKKEFVYEYPSVMEDTSLNNKYEYILHTLNKTEEDIRITPEILASYSLDDLEKLVSISSKTGIDPKLIPLCVYLKGLQSFLRNFLVLKDNNINLTDDEIAKFAIVLSINSVDFKKSLQLLQDYNVNLKKSDGKYAIMNLAISDIELAKKMDMLIEIGEEDIIKNYPEVLSTDVKELANRLVFVRKSEIPYKTESHNKVIYQSFVLKQEVLDKVLEKHIEINEILDDDETNNNLREILDDDSLLDELNKIDDSFEMISNTYLDDYKNVIKIIKNRYKETESSYVIGDKYFSKNKVNRNINYLLSIFTDANKEKVLAAGLLYDSRLSKEDMINVIETLNLKVK